MDTQDTKAFTTLPTARLRRRYAAPVERRGKKRSRRGGHFVPGVASVVSVTAAGQNNRYTSGFYM